MDERTSYWLELAEYDLDTARAMLATGRYLYVGFMCHQVIEKSLKAILSAAGSNPPRIHNLSKLAELSDGYRRMNEEQRDLLDSLEPLNVQMRYPEEKDMIFRAMTADRCARLLAQTEELYRWIRAML